MSTIFAEVKSQRLAARKAKATDTVSILTTLVGELETQSKKLGKDVTDEQVIATCKKFIANNDETIKLSGEDGPVYDMLINENKTLAMFLPKQLTEDELRVIIIQLAPANIGAAMGHLKTNYGGQYDGRMASQLVKELV